MKAAVIDNFGLENLKVKEVEPPKTQKGYIRVKPELAGINPLEYNVVGGKLLYGVNPMPHVPGSEIMGTSLEDGKNIRKGDRVVIYNRIYDGTCEYCVSGREYLCPNGGIYGVVSNGGYAEEISVKEENVFGIPDTISDYVAVSLPIDALTAYHALKESEARCGEHLVVYGASGNTGLFSVQLGRIMGMNVTAITRKKYLMEFGADQTYTMDNLPENLNADVLVNPLGGEFFGDSLKHMKRRGRMVTFGVLNGPTSTLHIGSIYTKELKIIGSTGGSRKDFKEIIDITEKNQLRVKVDKVFPLEEIGKAMEYFSGSREGRVLLKIN